MDRRQAQQNETFQENGPFQPCGQGMQLIEVPVCRQLRRGSLHIAAQRQPVGLHVGDH